MQLSHDQLISVVYTLSAIVVILSFGLISLLVKNGFQYILFGALMVVCWGITGVSFHLLPNLFKIIAIVPLLVSITPTIQFAGMIGLFDIPIFNKEK